MTQLTVRRLLVGLDLDPDTPLPRHWCGDDAFRTASLLALAGHAAQAPAELWRVAQPAAQPV